jgi:uncharacterized repeat protein (TIGR02543 family)
MASLSLALSGCQQTDTGDTTVAATAVSVSASANAVTVGDSIALTATVTPSDSTDSVSWSVSDGAAYVSLTADGAACTITGVAAGVAKVIATAGSVSSSAVEITVSNPTVAVTGITVSPESKTILCGATLQLSAAVSPSNASDTSVKWSVTEGSDIVSVSDSGLVTAGSVAGSAKVTATSVYDSTKTATATITVVSESVVATAVSITSTVSSVVVGSSIDLDASVTPSNSTDALVWSVSADDASIASVVASTGVVTGLAAGTATVVATAGSVSASVEVSVTAAVVTDPTVHYAVSFDLNYSGSTGAPSSQSVASGSTATEPTAPTRDALTFVGWYTDAACTTAYSFSTAVTADITLYAKWTLQVTDVTCFDFALPSTLADTGSVVEVHIKGTNTGANGFRSWLIDNSQTTGSNMLIYSSVSTSASAIAFPAGAYDLTYTLTSTIASTTRLFFKCYAYGQKIDSLQVDSITVTIGGTTTTIDVSKASITK